ncbi:MULTISPECIES: recombinase family protein [Rhizobium]|uniref:recombinase family protein n=1 Tax=Rhizobium TaxID=379 RepID=UPI002180ADF5|nr:MULTISPECIES: recombinase family protein [Rhizobium]
MLDHLRDADVVVITRLDRLARSTRDLLDIAERLNVLGAGLCSIAEPWADTTSPAGRMVLTVFGGTGAHPPTDKSRTIYCQAERYPFRSATSTKGRASCTWTETSG